MYIVPGLASQHLARGLAEHLNQPLAKTSIQRFADNEAYVRIEENLKNQDVLIVQTTYPDPHIIELFLLQDAAKEAHAKTITVITPYYGYGRQDKKFKDGEAISARALANHISLQADQFLTVDPHKDYLMDFFSIPSIRVSAAPAIAEFLKKKNIEFVLAPDKGALARVQEIAKQIGCPYDFIEKKRIDSHTVQIQPKPFNVCNKSVAIIDDIISTGGTMVQSVKELKKQGARDISVVCTHGLFIGDAPKKLRLAGCNHICSTDTIETQYSTIAVAPLIAEKLQTIVK